MKWLVIGEGGALKYFTETESLLCYIVEHENKIQAIQNVKENEHDGE